MPLEEAACDEGEECVRDRVLQVDDAPRELPSAAPRAPPGSRLTEEQRKEKRLAELLAEANSLLGMSDMTEAERARDAAQAAEFAAWRAAPPPPVAFDGPILVHTKAVPPGTTAETLALVERIKAAAPARA